ncbi:4Fe-4S dicluster domain-containing protein [Desulfonauticus submarinus]|uniref:4Fe-4S dicluster domain-containing protein n=1 Tax=Desulfonauticus submarinus TaxID=206665 RepID=A0A1H0F8M1_9BACT|nr:4Fe-4S binding protein [Desulfonauticus submarinus]SDN90994.1 4Fe-4S dicluster domain-containing protein [Desulfonauticus submarinus]
MKTLSQSFQIKTCRGCAKENDCPNSLGIDHLLIEKIKQAISQSKWPEFLKTQVKFPPKAHQQFRISISGCANACSQPQIVDFGLIRAIIPILDKDKCSQCKKCINYCEEQAITLENNYPAFNFQKCLGCGKCWRECPENAIFKKQDGFRILIGGKLGRHPRLAQELPVILSTEKSIELLIKILEFYQKHYQKGKRLGDLLHISDFNELMLCQENG